MAKQRDDHVERALDAEADDGLRSGAERAQMVRELVGAFIELAVAQRLAFEHQRGGVGRALGLFGEQLRDGDVRNRPRGIVPGGEDGAALAGRQDVESAGRCLGRCHRGREQSFEPRGDRRDGVTIEQVGAIVEPQPQLSSGRRRQAERVMRGVMAGDTGKTQSGGCGGAAGGIVHRIVLEHRHGIEQLAAQAGQRLHLGQPEMLVSHQLRLAVLYVADQGTERLAGPQWNTQRQGVDEQPHHGLDAGDLGRPARDRDAEHHVVAAGQPAEQDRPGGLDHAVERQPLGTRLPGQRGSRFLAQRQ